jgi:hypothetical protein
MPSFWSQLRTGVTNLSLILSNEEGTFSINGRDAYIAEVSLTQSIDCRPAEITLKILCSPEKLSEVWCEGTPQIASVKDMLKAVLKEIDKRESK